MKTTLTLTFYCLFSIVALAMPNSLPHSATTHNQELTVEEFTQMKLKDFKNHTGEKMTFKEKLAFRVVKKKLKRELRRGNIPADAAAPSRASDLDINIGALLLGFVFGLLGFLVVLIFFEDRDAWISALVGMAAWLVLVLIFV